MRKRSKDHGFETLGEHTVVLKDMINLSVFHLYGLNHYVMQLD